LEDGTAELRIARELIASGASWETVKAYLLPQIDSPDARVRLESRAFLAELLMRRGEFGDASKVLSLAWEELSAALDTGSGLPVGRAARGAIAQNYAIATEFSGNRELSRSVLRRTLQRGDAFDGETLDNSALTLASSYSKDGAVQEAVRVLESRISPDGTASQRVVESLALRATSRDVSIDEVGRNALHRYVDFVASRPTSAGVLSCAALAEQYAALGDYQRAIDLRIVAARAMTSGGSSIEFPVGAAEQAGFRDNLLRHQLSALLGAHTHERPDATMFAYDQLIALSTSDEEVASWTRQRDRFVASRQQSVSSPAEGR
jgi:tetratricopeptide (TPR) repeat protein